MVEPPTRDALPRDGQRGLSGSLAGGARHLRMTVRLLGSVLATHSNKGRTAWAKLEDPDGAAPWERRASMPTRRRLPLIKKPTR